GVSLRQLQRWLSSAEAVEPEGEDARKARLVAKIVNELRFVLTPAGTIDWFYWTREDLGSRRPVDLLGDPEQEPELSMASAGVRPRSRAGRRPGDRLRQHGGVRDLRPGARRRRLRALPAAGLAAAERDGGGDRAERRLARYAQPRRVPVPRRRAVPDPTGQQP